jgi:4-amino-4-deoxy-L-arabinose transferase-like glycosyltransferase
VVPVHDAMVYDTFAVNLVEGHGYGWGEGRPSVFWSPGAVFVYAAVYALFGHVYWPVVALQVAAGVGIAVITAHLAERLHGPTVARVAGLLMAIWPAQIQFVTLLSTELFFELLFLAALVVFLAGRPSWPVRALITGLLLGMACLVRPVAMLAPLLFALLVVGKERQVLRGGLAAALMLVALYGTLVPWALRNQRVFGEWVWVSANGGANLWMGNNPASSGEYMARPEEYEALPDPERDRVLRKLAMDYIRAEPVAFVTRSLKKLVKLHDRETIGVVWNGDGLRARYPEAVLGVVKLGSTVFWWGALALGLLGLGLVVAHVGPWRAALHPPVLLWAYFAAVHAAIVVMDRFHFPSVPFIAILGGLAASCLRARRRGAPWVLPGAAPREA